MVNKLMWVFLAVLGVGCCLHAEVLFSDSFDRPDSTDVNADSASSQGGTFAPVEYVATANKSAPSAEILRGRMLLPITGSGSGRLAVMHNLADDSADILAGGGFEISYTVRAGVNYEQTVHGAYASCLVLAQKNLIESSVIGLSNPWAGLYVQIQGNGQISVVSQAEPILKANANEKSFFVIGGDNTVRLVIKTDGFEKSSENSFVLFVNEGEIGTGNFSWKSSYDLSVALGADYYSAEFDDLRILTASDLN